MLQRETLRWLPSTKTGYGRGGIKILNAVTPKSADTQD